VRDEAEKHQVKERGEKALGNAKETGKGGVREGMRAWNGRKKSGKKA
jgi:hypothetical protein